MPVKSVLLMQGLVPAVIAVGLIVCVVALIILLRCRKDACKKKSTVAGDDGFSLRIPQYASLIKEWLENERPYLDRSFKLKDVAAVVPLNRTYLSRIFLEGLGESFSSIVCRLRMEEAKRLLSGEPEMSISEIAERCGFASHSSFHRAFVRSYGMKPGDYRQQNVA